MGYKSRYEYDRALPWSAGLVRVGGPSWWTAQQAYEACFRDEYEMIPAGGWIS
jgi:hypothetical protein